MTFNPWSEGEFNGEQVKVPVMGTWWECNDEYFMATDWTTLWDEDPTKQQLFVTLIPEKPPYQPKSVDYRLIPKHFTYTPHPRDEQGRPIVPGYLHKWLDDQGLVALRKAEVFPVCPECGEEVLMNEHSSAASRSAR